MTARPGERESKLFTVMRMADSHDVAWDALLAYREELLKPFEELAENMMTLELVGAEALYALVAKAREPWEP